MCVCARARVRKREGEIHPPSRMVRFLSLKPADDARVYAALGVWPVDVNISLYVAQTDSWTSPKEPLERRSVPDRRRMYGIINHPRNHLRILRHWYLHMHVNLLHLKGFQRAGTHCAVRLNAGLLFWTRATVVCLRPFTQPHLPVISSPNCSSSVPTPDPDWSRRERDIVSAWAGGRTRIHCAINAWCAPDPLKDARVLPICQAGARERFGGEAGEIISFVPHPAPRRNASPWGFKHTDIQLTRWAGRSLWNIRGRFNVHHSQKLTFLFRKWICRGIFLLNGSFFLHKHFILAVQFLMRH